MLSRNRFNDKPITIYKQNIKLFDRFFSLLYDFSTFLQNRFFRFFCFNLLVSEVVRI